MPAPPASRKVIVDFPEALYQETQRAVAELSIKRSVLIRDAVRQYLRRFQRQKLARELAEGYSANAELNQQISDEFKYVDAGNV
jgi:metal-responsive CopG/Arc/MetJ family transcriptional regulator